MKKILFGITLILLPLAMFGATFAGLWYFSGSTEAEQANDSAIEEPNDSANGEASDAVTTTAPPETPTIYVSIVTHSEDTQNFGTPDFSTDEDATLTERDGVAAFAAMLAEHGAKYDWQSDWNFLLGLAKWDEGSSATGGKNLAEYLVSLGMSTDPHSHQHNGYNYADVAYLMSQLGVTPSGIVGGFLAAPTEDSEYESLASAMKGSKYPSYTWTPTALWGGGTGLHIDESSQWTSGIWIPTSNESFFTPADSGTPVIGRYDGDFDGLDDLIAKQANGELEAGNMYTITITTNQNMLTDDYIAEFEKQIETYADETAAGKIVWVTLPEALEIWETQYASAPTILAYDGDGSYSTLSPRASNGTSSSTKPTQGTSSSSGLPTGLCGDGVCALIERQRNVCPADCD